MKKIICPNCGAEYLPAEIFYPDSLVGEPKDIEKDMQGKILYFGGTTINPEEEYICDYCKRKMTVFANISFNTNVSDFKEHVTKFNKPTLFMEED